MDKYPQIICEFETVLTWTLIGVLCSQDNPITGLHLLGASAAVNAGQVANHAGRTVGVVLALCSSLLHLLNSGTVVSHNADSFVGVALSTLHTLGAIFILQAGFATPGAPLLHYFDAVTVTIPDALAAPGCGDHAVGASAHEALVTVAVVVAVLGPGIALNRCGTEKSESDEKGLHCLENSIRTLTAPC